MKLLFVVRHCRTQRWWGPISSGHENLRLWPNIGIVETGRHLVSILSVLAWSLSTRLRHTLDARSAKRRSAFKLASLTWLLVCARLAPVDNNVKLWIALPLELPLLYYYICGNVLDHYVGIFDERAESTTTMYYLLYRMSIKLAMVQSQH
jgi:hypothetical protein